jgi:hypothetical protein
LSPQKDAIKETRRKKEPLLHTHFISPAIRRYFVSSLTRCFGNTATAATTTGEKNYFGWNLFTATSNIKLVSSLLFFSGHTFCAFFQPSHSQSQFILLFTNNRYRRITELPNCFSLSVFLPHHLSSLFSCWQLAIVMLKTHTTRPPKKVEKNERNEIKAKRKVTVAMGKF